MRNSFKEFTEPVDHDRERVESKGTYHTSQKNIVEAMKIDRDEAPLLLRFFSSVADTQSSKSLDNSDLCKMNLKLTWPKKCHNAFTQILGRRVRRRTQQLLNKVTVFNIQPHKFHKVCWVVDHL